MGRTRRGRCCWSSGSPLTAAAELAPPHLPSPAAPACKALKCCLTVMPYMRMAQGTFALTEMHFNRGRAHNEGRTSSSCASSLSKAEVS